ncbi:MAG: hypothetical protein EXR43_02440 [Dehalococcoidia bacterium]|nr:hypothetical protein [Dehalococcoidia bacterium]
MQRYAICLTALAAATLMVAASLVPTRAAPGDPIPIDVFSRLGAIEAWAHSTGEGVIVAVIDSGVALQHPDLQGSAALNATEAAGISGRDDDGNSFPDDLLGWDFIAGNAIPLVAAGLPSVGNGLDDDGDGQVDNGVAHGTEAAGLIAGRTTGIAPGAKILPIRILDDEGNGSLINLVAAIDYARQRGARVIYIGVGFPENDTAVSEAVARATAAGSLIVAPAGNSESVLFPAALPATLSAGATQDGAPAPYSAWGIGVDIAAPGSRLLAPQIAAVTGELGYARVTGTSFSAAIVAGAAALLRSAVPALTPEQTARYLIASADPIPGGGDIGLLNIGRAVRLASGR